MSKPALNREKLWEFEASIEYHDFGRMGYTVVYVPELLCKKLPLDAYPRLRINAEIAEWPVEGALQPGQGKTYLMLSKRWLKQAGLALGDTVEVAFRIADQDAVSLPDSLRHALNGNTKANKAWADLSAGKQRALAHLVSTAKRQDTIDKRITKVLDHLLGVKLIKGMDR